MQRLKVAYNDAMLSSLKIARGSSASQMFVTAEVSTFHELIRNLMFQFMKRFEDSGNSIIVVLVNPTLSCARFTPSLRVHWLQCLYIN